MIRNRRGAWRRSTHRRAALALVLLGLVGGLLTPLSPAGAASGPAINLSPYSGDVGTSVKVSGTGFPRRVAGSIKFNSATVGAFSTNRRGSFSATFTVPNVLPGIAEVKASGGGLSATASFSVTAPLTEPDALVDPDALHRRVRAELAVFTSWLEKNGASGFIGEVGWPNSMPADMDRWNGLAEAWYRDAEAAGLLVTAWSTGEWWPNAHDASIYVNSGASLDTPRPQAPVVEGQPTAMLRGVNAAGGEFGTPGSTQATSSFSNIKPGTYDTDWHYDSQASFNYLASRGITTIRVPFRWERIQPTLGGALDEAELQRLSGAVARAKQAGLGVILDVHNYGAYYLHDGQQGVRRAIGTPEVTIAHFSDLWRRLSAHFKGSSGILAYGLMNEPVNMPSVGARTPAQVWEQASQEALSAIRANGDSKMVLVSGYLWSPTWRWSTVHPQAWITDTLNSFRYEAHHYFDRNRSGRYAYTYDDEVADASSKGY